MPMDLAALNIFQQGASEATSRRRISIRFALSPGRWFQRELGREPMASFHFYFYFFIAESNIFCGRVLPLSIHHFCLK